MASITPTAFAFPGRFSCTYSLSPYIVTGRNGVGNDQLCVVWEATKEHNQRKMAQTVRRRHGDQKVTVHKQYCAMYCNQQVHGDISINLYKAHNEVENVFDNVFRNSFRYQIFSPRMNTFK